MYVVGGAAVITSTVLFVLMLKSKDERQVTVTPLVGPGIGGVSTEFSF